MGVWAGWLIPFEEPIVLVANANQDITAATVQLARIGYDHVVGVVTDLGKRDKLATYRLASIADLRNGLRMASPQILDVRPPADWEVSTIPGSFHRYVPDLRSRLPDGLDSEQPVWVICGGGYRSQMAVRYLEAGGFEPIVVTGGGVAEVLAGDQA
jgi:rhodanese-related sulfurtransferase